MSGLHFLPDGTLNRTDPLVLANEKLAQYYSQYHGNPVPIDPIPGVIVASILVSILGSYATLLVLGRRTSPRGVRNLALLLLAAVCFAAVAVWGMHFVSMISIRLNATRGLSHVGLGESDIGQIVWYITFSPGMTVLSLFVPLVATAFAFWFLASEVEFSYWRGLISGIIVGLTIGLMHYSAAFKLPYLAPEYTTVTVVFSLILACIAATVALGLFFRLREQWQDSFWKRCVCALALATAVCGMHYLGLGGARYFVKQNIAFPEKGAVLESPTKGPWVLLSGKSQANRLTIAIGVMCACIIALSAAIAILDYLIRRDIRNKARHIVVASVAFDPTGKLLVRHDGTIPMQIIQTDADLSRVLNELDPRRPTFQWLYQLSFNWQIVTPFVPRILREIANRGKKTETPPPPTSDRSMNRSVWEQLLFRSRFVEACVLLAHQLDLSIESLGVMFDRVLTTGTRQRSPGDAIGDEKNLKADDESSIHGITVHLTASEGVMLFIVRTIGHGNPASHDVPSAEKQLGVSSDNVDSYLVRGYRLTETRFFSKTLADNMGVSKQEMDVFLSACKTYAKRGTRAVVQSGGAYLGLFGVRPTSDNGLDVLVYNFARHQIPAYRLPDVSYPLTPSMRAFIRDCANLSMGEVLQRCNDAVQAAENSDNDSILSLDETLYEFQAAIAVAVEALTTALRCWPDLQVTARLSPEILGLPTSDNDDKLPAQMIVFEVVLGAPEARITPVQSRASGVQAPGVRSGRHDSDKPPAPFVYTPYNLFTKSQTMLMRARGRQDFNRASQADLGRLYPFIANDVAAELREAEEMKRRAKGFTSRMSKISKGLSVDTSGRAPSFREGVHEMQMPVSPGSEPDAVPPAGVRKVGDGFGRKAGSVKTDRFEEEDDLRSQTTTDAPGPAVYGDIRLKAEGWYSRSMRTMERNDRGGLLNGVDLSE
ncbi:hypothetical protein CspHIS471_0210240 [Cutaneotrichosporon sp. HIS471]|nr:hypothetical protein CspHIS471_0210240 [Cutaneotrichosporon sp. HIS471]